MTLDFTTVAASEFAKFKGGSGFPTRYQGSKSGHFPFFKVSDMNNPGNERMMIRANNYITEEQRQEIGAVVIPAGAVVFAKVGAAVFLERKRVLAQDSCIDNNMAAMIADPLRARTSFVYYQLTAFQLSSLVATTALPSLNGSQLRSIPLALPPTLEEQDRIVQALSDADRMIAKLERLIGKKQAIKRGMMQQLLTGKTRLPGYGNDWVSCRFGDIALPIKERANPSDMPAETEVVELEHLGSGTGALEASGVLSNSVSEKTRFRAGDVLFGKLRAYLRKYWLADRGGLCSTEIWALRAQPGRAIGGFVRYLVESDSFVEAASASHGTHMPRSEWRIVSSLELRVPRIDEQRAIAGVLLDSDREITTLRTYLQRARLIKQGMLQELLTGRTRLTAGEDVT